MSSYVHAIFHPDKHHSYRPTYPPQVYLNISDYHTRAGGQFGTCVDIGCGTGEATRELAKMFDRVIGVDPSEEMIRAAKKTGGKTRAGREIEWKVGTSDKMPFLEDASVDIVTAGTSCQYFKWPDTWDELARILKPRGTAAFFNYTATYLADPLVAINPIIDHCMNHVINGLPPTSVGMSMLGVSTLNAPEEIFDVKNAGKCIYIGEHYAHIYFGKRNACIMRKQMTWKELEGYFRSGGAVQKYLQDHPEEKNRPDGDVITRLIKELKDEAAKLGFKGDEVTIEHPLVIFMLTKVA